MAKKRELPEWATGLRLKWQTLEDEEIVIRKGRHDLASIRTFDSNRRGWFYAGLALKGDQWIWTATKSSASRAEAALLGLIEKQLQVLDAILGE